MKPLLKLFSAKDCYLRAGNYRGLFWLKGHEAGELAPPPSEGREREANHGKRRGYGAITGPSIPGLELVLKAGERGRCSRESPKF